MIRETGQNRGKGRPAGSGGRRWLHLVQMLGCIFVFAVYLLPVRLHAQAGDSLSNRIDTISTSGNSARFFLCKWNYTGQNVSGISIIGSTDYYGQNTSGYCINGLELSIDGGAKQLNGLGIGVGLLSPYGIVNGVLFNPFFTTASHLRGMAGPCLAIDVDTLDGLAPFSLFAANSKLNGFSAAGVWQTSSIANGVVLSGIGHRYDASFIGFAGCGIVGIYGGDFQGFTVSGIGNHFNGNASGLALSAIYNNASQGFNGFSVSLLRNKSRGQFNGLQTAAFCRTEKLSGVQFGLINRSNRVSGVQFGLINIIHSNPKGRRVLPIVNWCISAMKDTVISGQKDSLARYRIYGPDGFLKHEYFLKNGLLHGVENFYLTRNKIERSVSWQNGKKHGWEVDNLDPDLTALFWENDSLLIIRHTIKLPVQDEITIGTWFLEEHTSGKRVVFLVRAIQQDTINRIVNGIREGLHFLGIAGRAAVWGNFSSGKICGVYIEDPSGKKIPGKINETLPLNFEVIITIREKTLFDYDEYQSNAVSYVLYPFFPENCRITISLFNTANELLFNECVIKEKTKFTRRDTSCSYFSTEEYNNKQKVYYWNSDSVTSTYRNGKLAFSQLLSPEKTTSRENGSRVVVTKSATVYYKNNQRAAYQTKDTLLLYSKRGKPVLSILGDSTTFFRKDGSELLFYCPEYRRYSSRSGKIIAERFGDSLVKYDDAGELSYYALIDHDSVRVYAAGDTIESISGHIFTANMFYIKEFKHIVGEMEMVCLVLGNSDFEHWCGKQSIRVYEIKKSVSPYFRWPECYFDSSK